MRHAHVCFAVVLVCLVAGGCGEDPARVPQPASDAAADQAAEERARLQALPYAGSIEIDEDAPDGVVHAEPALASRGHSLFVVFQKCLAELLGSDGQVVHRWSAPGDRNWDNAELLPDGDLVVPGAAPSDSGVRGIEDEKRYLMRVAPDNSVVWRVQLNAHHDVERAPDGRLLTLAFERRRVREIAPDVDCRDDVLTWLDAEGNVVETMPLLEPVRQRADLFPLTPIAASAKTGRSWIDVFHCNSVETMRHEPLFGTHPLYHPDHVLVCSRHQDRVFIVDRRSRALVWAWGQGVLDGPHDATLLPDGNVMVFDNGLVRKWSRVVVVDPRANQIVWQYQAAPPQEFFTPTKGANQRLPGGNTLITESDRGRVFEVNPAGERVWEWLNPHRIDDTGERPRRATIVRFYRLSDDVASKALEAIRRRMAGGASPSP